MSVCFAHIKPCTCDEEDSIYMHPSGRTRIASIYARQLSKDAVEPYCAGFDPSHFPPLPINLMKEEGLEMSSEAPPSVFDLKHLRFEMDEVVVLCESNSTENCLVFLETVKALFSKKAHCRIWSIQSFMNLKGSPEERLEGARMIRDRIKRCVDRLLVEVGEVPAISSRPQDPG